MNVVREIPHESALFKAAALQKAILGSAYFSSIATDEKGVIQLFNVGAERMLGYTASEVVDKITPADISDPLEVIARAKALSLELGAQITPGFEALVFKASRGRHLRTDLHPQGWKPLSGGRIGYGAARRSWRSHWLSVDWHRQYRAQEAGRRSARSKGGTLTSGAACRRGGRVELGDRAEYRRGR